MIKKPLSIALLSVAVLASIPMVAMAYPHGYGRHYDGYHRGYYQGPELTEEQLSQMDSLCEEHSKALRPLYDQLTEKRLELRALSPNPNVKPEELKALTAEIAKLHEQIRSVNDEFYTKMTKSGLPCRGYYQRGGDGWCDMPRRGHGYGCGYWR